MQFGRKFCSHISLSSHFFNLSPNHRAGMFNTRHKFHHCISLHIIAYMKKMPYETNISKQELPFYRTLDLENQVADSEPYLRHNPVCQYCNLDESRVCSLKIKTLVLTHISQSDLGKAHLPSHWRETLMHVIIHIATCTFFDNKSVQHRRNDTDALLSKSFTQS